MSFLLCSTRFVRRRRCFGLGQSPTRRLSHILNSWKGKQREDTEVRRGWLWLAAGAAAAIFVAHKTTKEETAEATTVIETPHIKTTYNTLLVGTTWGHHFLRVLQIIFYFLPVILFVPIAYLIPATRRFWWGMLHSTLSKLGGCWIKLAQWASTRPDLFPPLLISFFTSLTDRCPCHSYRWTNWSIVKAFNLVSVDDMFKELDHVPLASGAIAQVHKGTLHDGTSVVVKVLHPNILCNIESDLWIMNCLSISLSFLPGVKWLGFSDGIKQFSSTMLEQSNLATEAHNLIRFHMNFMSNPNVEFPTVIRATPETFEEGKPIYNYLQVDAPDVKRKLAKIGLEAYLQMMLVDNFVHADLHPGNMLVREEASGPKIIMLDCGLVTVASPLDWSHLKDLLMAITSGDGKRGAELMIEYARHHELQPNDKERFTTSMGELFDKISSSQLEKIHVGLVLTKILNLVRKHHIQLEGNYATLVVGTVILEGIGKQLDPNVNLLEEAKPFLFTTEIGREITKETAKNLAGSIFNKAKIIVSPSHNTYE